MVTVKPPLHWGARMTPWGVKNRDSQTYLSLATFSLFLVFFRPPCCAAYIYTLRRNAMGVWKRSKRSAGELTSTSNWSYLQLLGANRMSTKKSGRALNCISYRVKISSECAMQWGYIQFFSCAFAFFFTLFYPWIRVKKSMVISKKDRKNPFWWVF